jgi:hypothetical protein
MNSLTGQKGFSIDVSFHGRRNDREVDRRSLSIPVNINCVKKALQLAQSSARTIGSEHRPRGSSGWTSKNRRTACNWSET